MTRSSTTTRHVHHDSTTTRSRQSRYALGHSFGPQTIRFDSKVLASGEDMRATATVDELPCTLFQSLQVLPRLLMVEGGFRISSASLPLEAFRSVCS